MVGWFWLLFEAFRTSFLWGLFSLLVWPVLPVWSFLHFRRAKWPGLIWMIGVVLSAVALHGIAAAGR
jgi:hypothetical protein